MEAPPGFLLRYPIAHKMPSSGGVAEIEAAVADQERELRSTYDARAAGSVSDRKILQLNDYFDETLVDEALPEMRAALESSKNWLTFQRALQDKDVDLVTAIYKAQYAAESAKSGGSGAADMPSDDELRASLTAAIAEESTVAAAAVRVPHGVMVVAALERVVASMKAAALHEMDDMLRKLDAARSALAAKRDALASL